MTHNSWHAVAHEVCSDLVRDLSVDKEPVLKRLEGVYRLDIKKGILMPSPYDGLWGFCDMRTGEVMALFAEYDVWLSLIPAGYADRFARADDASQYDLPTFVMDGLPVLMSRQSLFEGLIAPAKVPVSVEVFDAEKEDER